MKSIRGLQGQENEGFHIIGRMINIGMAVVLPGGSPWLLRKMGMVRGDLAFVRWRSGIVSHAHVGMKKRRREENEED